MRIGATLSRAFLVIGLAGSLGFGAVQTVAAPRAADPDPDCIQPGPTPFQPCRCPDGTSGWCNSLGKCVCPT